MLNYFRSSADIEADKEASRLVMQRSTANLVMILQELVVFEGTFQLRMKEDSYSYQNR